MSKYPDWVNAFKEKGTAIKKVGESYYLYSVTSKRVKGKKYPQPIQKFIGTITPDGVVKSVMRKVSTERVRVFEYGLSFALRHLLPKKFIEDFHDAEKAEQVFLNIVKSISPASYLLRDTAISTPEELHISLCTYKKKFERMAGIAISDLEPLSNLYLVETKETDMLSEVTTTIQEILERIGVNEYGLQT